MRTQPTVVVAAFLIAYICGAISGRLVPTGNEHRAKPREELGLTFAELLELGRHAAPVDRALAMEQARDKRVDWQLEAIEVDYEFRLARFAIPGEKPDRRRTCVVGFPTVQAMLGLNKGGLYRLRGTLAGTPPVTLVSILEDGSVEAAP